MADSQFLKFSSVSYPSLPYVIMLQVKSETPLPLDRPSFLSPVLLKEEGAQYGKEAYQKREICLHPGAQEKCELVHKSRKVMAFFDGGCAFSRENYAYGLTLVSPNADFSAGLCDEGYAGYLAKRGFLLPCFSAIEKMLRPIHFFE